MVTPPTSRRVAALLPILTLALVALGPGCPGNDAPPADADAAARDAPDAPKGFPEEVGPRDPGPLDEDDGTLDPGPIVELPPPLKGFGEACETPAECESGFCVQFAGGKVCSKTCLASCPRGWICTQAGGSGGDLLFVCTSAFWALCRPCVDDSDCLSGGDRIERCLRYGPAGRFCGGTCEVPEDCPEGFDCVDRRADGFQCVRSDGDCPCRVTGSVQLATRCEITNEFGTCEGDRTCTAAGYLPCTAATPGAEVCDRKDNDCDGLTDEDVEKCCKCGDQVCDLAICGEDVQTCPVDCKVCGDGACTPTENPAECPEDCCGTCGDGRCIGYRCGESPITCARDCATPCGNQVCDPGETPQSCAEDCDWQACGNGVCEPQDGGPDACPADCGVTCGNCACEQGEDWLTCPIDCGFCGDGICSTCPGLGENEETCLADCDDGVEVCNGKDDDGDGQTDPEGAAGCLDYHRDADRDGYGTAESRCLCRPDGEYTAPKPSTAKPKDCRDDDPFVHPGAPETCNGLDDDCDGTTDPKGADGCTPYFADADQDGWGSSQPPRCLCAPEAPSTCLRAGDCDDGAPAVHPEAPETCNGLDDDCDGTTDGMTRPCTAGCGDGLETCTAGTWAGCTAPQPRDCTDWTTCATVPSCIPCAPAPAEACNGVDDDCDGTTDGMTRPCTAGCGDGTETCTAGTWAGCTAPRPRDCTDWSDCATVPSCGPCAPTPAETCNGVDDDCDGATDEGLQCVRPPGDPCGADGECLSGHCGDGFCCVSGECCASAADCAPPGACQEVACQDSQCRVTGCDDGNPCTVDSCQPPADGAACVHTAIQCEPTTDPCKVNECNPSTGACELRRQADGTPCEDGLYCTTGDACAAGACTAGPARDCSYPGLPCVTGVCSEDLRQCLPSVAPDDTPCDDGDVCVTGDYCQAGACQPGCVGGTCHAGGANVCPCPNGDGDCVDDGDKCNGTTWTCNPSSHLCELQDGPVVCEPAGVECRTRVCDPVTGLCGTRDAPDLMPCEDGRYCTVADFCQGGACTGNLPRDCSALDADCSQGVCDEGARTCVPEPVSDGTACERDGLGCTEDACTGGECVFHAMADCSAVRDDCNDGVCQNVGWSGHVCLQGPVADGTACTDDAAPCTADRCEAGQCRHTRVQNCVAPCGGAHAYDAGDDDCGTEDSCANGIQGYPNGYCTPTCSAPACVGVASGPVDLPVGAATGCTVSPVDLSTASAFVESVRVKVNLSHASLGDLTLDLVDPQGYSHRLWNHVGGANADLHDTFGLSFPVPYPGLPTSGVPLCSLAGEQAPGRWSLKVCDTVAGNDGVLHDWALYVRGSGDATLNLGHRCGDAIDLGGAPRVPAVIVDGTTQCALNGVTDAGCGGADGPDRLYRFTLTTPSHATIRLSQPDRDLVLFLKAQVMDGCAAGSMECAQAHGAGATPEVIDRQLDPGVYFVGVDSAGGPYDDGAYRFELRLQPLKPDGAACLDPVLGDQDLDCQGGRCQNGVCCPAGDCCTQAGDCPAQYTKPPACDDAANCQGHREVPTCVDSLCGSLRVEDDSGCDEGTIASACGFWTSRWCDGTADQVAPTCPSTCTGDSDCDANAHCGGPLAVLPDATLTPLDRTCTADLANGQACSEDSDCQSGHCGNGFCAGTGDGCPGPEFASLCPALASPGAVCTDPASCQGNRWVRTCDNFQCGQQLVDDDSACAQGVIALDCGLFQPARCSGLASQPFPTCRTSCLDGTTENNAYCLPGNHCAPVPGSPSESVCTPDLPGDADCVEDSDCTTTRCIGGKCCVCADSNACTRGACDAAGACGQRPAMCDDGVPCTIDSCDPIEGCQHTPQVCDTSGCGPGLCFEGTCVGTNLCDDQDPSTSDTCTGGTCSHARISCEDFNYCTDDAWDWAAGQCVHVPKNCGVSDKCGTSWCDPATGTCRSNRTCDDANLCTNDVCDPATGACSFEPVRCDDANECTIDMCNPVTGACVHEPITCDDFDRCTQNLCSPTLPGGCYYKPRDCNDMDPCTDDACNPMDGTCVNIARTCDDGDPCTDDACNPSTGQCFQSNNVAPCNDSDPCTLNDHCQDGVCVPGTPNECDDLDPCTIDYCTPSDGCHHVAGGC